MDEWNGHLEICSRPQAIIENSSQYLLLRTDILRKTVVGVPGDSLGIVFSPFTAPLQW